MWDVWSDFALLAATALVAAVAVEAFTEIITSSELSYWLIQTPLSRRALPDNPENVRWYWTHLYKLMSCGYCFSVVAALGFAWFLPGRWFGLLPWDNLLVKWMLLHRLSNWWHIRYVLLQRGRIIPQDVLLKISGDSTSQPLKESEADYGTDRQ